MGNGYLGTVPIFAGTAAKLWSTKMGLSPLSLMFRDWHLCTLRRGKCQRKSCATCSFSGVMAAEVIEAGPK